MDRPLSNPHDPRSTGAAAHEIETRIKSPLVLSKERFIFLPRQETRELNLYLNHRIVCTLMMQLFSLLIHFNFEITFPKVFLVVTKVSFFTNHMSAGKLSYYTLDTSLFSGTKMHILFEHLFRLHLHDLAIIYIYHFCHVWQVQ